ncbi:unnamed protein product [Bemisia tabaci]|uniref:MADF domain-containing protein n=1 Tax=Bemisia tabaci TaxID=7038 RepID=A0A9P0F2N1_BEMTA|nr:unnamed protein product [Bemisia tabaci]
MKSNIEMVDRSVLIGLVRQRSSLWDPQDRHYRSREMRTRLWDDVGQELGVTGEVARKNWEILRDIFRRKSKDIETFKSRVISEGNPALRPVSRWIYFDEMSFLADVMRPRPQKNPQAEEGGSPDDCEQDDDDEEVDTRQRESGGRSDLQCLTCSGGKKKKRLSAKKRKSQNLSKSREEEDDDMMFFRSLLPYMKKLGPLQRMKLRSTILDNVVAAIETSEESGSKTALVPLGREAPSDDQVA